MTVRRTNRRSCVDFVVRLPVILYQSPACTVRLDLTAESYQYAMEVGCTDDSDVEKREPQDPRREMSAEMYRMKTAQT